MPHPPAVKHRANRLSFPENRDALPDALTAQYRLKYPTYSHSTRHRCPSPGSEWTPKLPLDGGAAHLSTPAWVGALSGVNTGGARRER